MERSKRRGVLERIKNNTKKEDPTKSKYNKNSKRYFKKKR